MKKIKVPLILVLLSLAVFSATAQKVTVYSNDFNGIDAEFGIGKYDYMTLVRAGVSLVRSVKVPAGMQVTLYEKDNFEGTSLVLLQSANRKLIEGKGFGKIAMNVSIIVEKAPEAVLKEPTITIFKDNFSGPSLNLRAGYYDHYELGTVDNDKVSSVKVPQGMKVTLYEHGGYKGRSLILTQDANANYLIKNKFNDITSSLYIEVLPKPEPEPVKEIPVVVPVVVVEETEKDLAADDPAAPRVTIYEGLFGGASKKLGHGRYDALAMGIGDNALSSIKIPTGLLVTLYDQPNFKGKSLVLRDQDAALRNMDNFDNVVSSMVVELIPRAIIYHDNFSGVSNGLEPGYYYNSGNLHIGNDELSSVKILPGIWVLLFEDNNFSGRSLLLTKDASEDFMAGKEFNNLTSSMVVGGTNTPLPEVILFDDDREDAFKKLTPGSYPLLEAGNNMLSSIDIPRGLKVTLFEDAGYEGRAMEITKSVGTDFMKMHAFDNITSSLIIEQRDPRDLFVTIYSGSFQGFSQQLTPGKYYSRDLEIGTKDLSSLKVPRGMQVELFPNDNFDVAADWADRDKDYTGSKMFDNHYTSLIVKDIHQPVVTPVKGSTPVPVEEPKPPVEVERAPTAVYNYESPCTMNDDQYQNALRSIEAKPFSEEKMEMVMLVTKDKCLTNDQIRGIARQFNFEEQSLEFVKYAYDKATEKSTFYLLEDVFKFNSSKDAFRKFLKEK